MKQILLSGILFFMTATNVLAQQCPAGSHPWVDDWGNRICRKLGSGQTTTIEGSTKQCPTGTYSWVDEWGNRTCKSFQGNTQYYDTSKGCPVGSHPWTDSWGNAVCKKF